jgi:hypothetical protein
MVKEELLKQLDSLSEEKLSEVLDFARLLQEPPEELTEEELKEVQAGQEEFARGEWVRWEDIRREDV